MSYSKKKCEKCGAETGIVELYDYEDSTVEHPVCKAHRTVQLKAIAEGKIL